MHLHILNMSAIIILQWFQDSYILSCRNRYIQFCPSVLFLGVFEVQGLCKGNPNSSRNIQLGFQKRSKSIYKTRIVTTRWKCAPVRGDPKEKEVRIL